MTWSPQQPYPHYPQYPPPKPGGGGKTWLVVLLIVFGGIAAVGICGVVGAVFLFRTAIAPAVQAVQDSAAKDASLNNLKRIGMAMHAYHDALQTFPPPSCSTTTLRNRPCAITSRSATTTRCRRSPTSEPRNEARQISPPASRERSRAPRFD